MTTADKTSSAPTAAASESSNSADLELAKRSYEGDRTAQKQLFNDHKTRVHATLYRILGSNQDMEDLVQDAFIEVFKSLRSFRGDAKLSTWVNRITTRVAFAYISKRKPRAEDIDNVPVSADTATSDRQATARDALRRLYSVLERLDPKYRVAYALHVIDGRPMKEVAAMMDASLVATKSRVWRARRDVEKRARRDPLLAEYLDGQGDEQ